MSVKEVVKMTGEVPNWFESEGKRYEVLKGTMADGSHSLMVWEMKDGKKIHLHYITYGETPEEARENLKRLMVR